MTSLLARLRRWRRRRRTRQITLENARQRAARGAAYLDKADPGWHRRLDLGALALGDGESCVLGQLHGSFRNGLGRARLFSPGSAPRASLSPVAHGFHGLRGVEADAQERDYELLDRAWREEIRRRQREDEPPARERHEHRERPAEAYAPPVPA